MEPTLIGNAIKSLRRSSGHTQKELAEHLGVTAQAVSKWERGLGMPDIAIISKLALFLNTDIDNLLEGNISYLSHNMVGVLEYSPDKYCIPPDAVIAGRPLITIFLSYFLLAGVHDINIVGSEAGIAAAGKIAGDGKRYGCNFVYSREPVIGQDTFPVMFMTSDFFLYGVNLTRYFQRAISNNPGVSILALNSAGDRRRDQLFFDRSHLVKRKCVMDASFMELPVFFLQQGYFNYNKKIQINKESLINKKKLAAVPLGRGMIYSTLTSEYDLRELERFFSFAEKNTGMLLFCLEEIAWRRGFITRAAFEILASESPMREYLSALS